MPKRNGTGPLGFGPKTGWGLGPCAWPAARQGYGYGFGSRRGLGWNFNPYSFYPFYERLTKKDKLEILESEAAYLEEELKEIKKQISEVQIQK